MTNEDYLIRMSLMQQEGEKLAEQLQFINQQIAEFEVLKLSLENLKKSKGKEILADLGKGIFIKSKIEEEKLFVNVGEGVVVKKTKEETIKIIDKQINQLENLKRDLMKEIEKINSELEEIAIKLRSSN